MMVSFRVLQYFLYPQTRISHIFRLTTYIFVSLIFKVKLRNVYRLSYQKQTLIFLWNRGSSKSVNKKSRLSILRWIFGKELVEPKLFYSIFRSMWNWKCWYIYILWHELCWSEVMFDLLCLFAVCWYRMCRFVLSCDCRGSDKNSKSMLVMFRIQLLIGWKFPITAAFSRGL